MKRQYLVVFEKAAEDNWGAFALDIPGAVGAGSNLNEARISLVEAMNIQLEDIAERELPLPLDVSTSVDLAKFDPERAQTHYVLEWLTVDLPKAGSKPNDLSQHAV